MSSKKEHDFKRPNSVDDVMDVEGAAERGTSTPGESGERDEPLYDLSEEALALVEQLQRERDDAVEGRKRALADYANFQRRSRENESRARLEGVHGVLRSLIPVIDHFELALQQDPAKTSVEQLLGGVRMVQVEMLKALEAHGVRRIEPAVGEAFDPMQHEAMLRRQAEGVAPNHVVAVLQPGVAVGDMVLRPAKVAVAPEA